MKLPDTSAARVLVVGDVMLDRYWFGDVSRISPEAPVPVVKVDRSEERPGGAANVARNIAALGAQVALLSVVGTDEAGTTLARLLEESAVDASLHADPQLNTTVKLRVLGRQQQLLRIDFENSPAHEVLQAKLTDFEQRITACDVVILSDYGKGGLTHISEMIRIARAHGNAGAGRSQRRRLCPLRRGQPDHPESCGTARGGRALERRGRPGDACDPLAD